MSRPRVVVVGGGLAGLTAAIACADNGAEVELFEARPRFGGATWSFERNGRYFDNGQHVYLRCCTAYRRLLERLGTAELAPIAGALSIPVYRPDRRGGSRRAVIGRGNLPPPLHLAAALLRYRHLPVADRLRLVSALGALQRLSLSDATLDGESFGAFLRRHGQSELAIRRLFDLIVTPTTNLRSDEVSLALGAKVFKTGLLDEADGADIGWSQAPLNAVHVDPAIALIEALGGRCTSRARVQAVEGGGEGAPLEVVVDGQRVGADAVILALTPHATAELLERRGLDFAPALRAFASEPIIDLHIVFDRKVVAEALVAAVDSPVQYVFDRTAASGCTTGQCLALSISAASAEIGEPAESLQERYVRALGELFPAVRRARVIDFFVSRERAATFRGTPGTAVLRHGAATAIGGLFLAGTWTATGWPATMEGAVRSGNRAAWHAMQSVGSARGALEYEEVVA